MQVKWAFTVQISLFYTFKNIWPTSSKNFIKQKLIKQIYIKFEFPSTQKYLVKTETSSY